MGDQSKRAVAPLEIKERALLVEARVVEGEGRGHAPLTAGCLSGGVFGLPDAPKRLTSYLDVLHRIVLL